MFLKQSEMCLGEGCIHIIFKNEMCHVLLQVYTRICPYWSENMNCGVGRHRLLSFFKVAMTPT